MTAATNDDGMDLRDAMRGVDAREYIPLLDAIRDNPETLRKFVTYLAQENPPVFIKYAKYITGGAPGVNWYQIDEMLHKGDVIPAIKIVREVTGKGLKEAKQLVDERRSRLGIYRQTF